MTSPESGWYEDPVSPGHLRWWDGVQWTNHQRPVEAPPAAPATAAPAATDRDEADERPPAPAMPDGRTPVPSVPPTGTQGRTAEGFGGPGDARHPFGTDTGAPRKPDRSANRRVLLAAGVAAVVVFGGLVAFMLGSTSVLNLAVGDCFTDDIFDGREEIERVDTVNCGDPHVAEIFAAFELSGDTWPGETDVSDRAQDGCVERFEAAVGAPFAYTDLDVGSLYPLERSWNQADDRGVSCYLLDRGGFDLVGTRLGLVQAHPGLQPQVGDCLVTPIDGLEEVPGAGRVRLVDCATPHYGEVFARVSLGEAGDGWPGGFAAFVEGDGACYDEWFGHMGEAWETSPLDYTVVTPSRDQWAVGERTGLCVVVDIFGDAPIVGPAADWAQRPEVREALSSGRPYGIGHLAPGDCFDDPDGPLDGDVPLVSCSDEHDNEVFHTFDLPAGPFPDDLAETVLATCDQAFAEWIGTGTVNDQLDWFWLGPDRVDWESDDRRVACMLYDLDLDKLVGSRRGGQA